VNGLLPAFCIGEDHEKKYYVYNSRFTGNNSSALLSPLLPELVNGPLRVTLE
jgi:hypothetical protein